MKRLFGIRGAVCAENTKESISLQTAEMCRKLFSENSLSAADIVSVQFTLTRDLDVFNPCAALRANDVGIDTSRIPLFCSQEAYMDENAVPSPVYMGGAEVLRPDFCK